MSALPVSTLIILGPTAVGKSELAVQLAEVIGGEIVGCDAFQVYQGLDILSAKPSQALLDRVPHHLIGEIPLSDSFDVAQYHKMAHARIAEILARGRKPILCGGTGFYARALTHGLAETPPANPELRTQLAAQPLETLVAQLHQLDPAACVDKKNPRRVIRALEVCLLSGRPFSSYRSEPEQVSPNIHGIILTLPREELYRRIDLRTLAMFEQGVVEEVAQMGAISPTASQMIGLREIQSLLAGSMTRKDCIAAIQQNTRNYAKRQITWFRRERGYEWLDLSATKTLIETALKLFEKN
jgi:tRNA dimethylallyltransferase